MSTQRYVTETFCPQCEDLHTGAVAKCARCGCANLRTWKAPVPTIVVMGAAERAELPAA